MSSISSPSSSPAAGIFTQFDQKIKGTKEKIQTMAENAAELEKLEGEIFATLDQLFPKETLRKKHATVKGYRLRIRYIEDYIEHICSDIAAKQYDAENLEEIVRDKMTRIQAVKESIASIDQAERQLLDHEEEEIQNVRSLLQQIMEEPRLQKVVLEFRPDLAAVVELSNSRWKETMKMVNSLEKEWTNFHTTAQNTLVETAKEIANARVNSLSEILNSDLEELVNSINEIATQVSRAKRGFAKRVQSARAIFGDAQQLYQQLTHGLEEKVEQLSQQLSEVEGKVKVAAENERQAKHAMRLEAQRATDAEEELQLAQSEAANHTADLEAEKRKTEFQRQRAVAAEKKLQEMAQTYTADLEVEREKTDLHRQRAIQADETLMEKEGQHSTSIENANKRLAEQIRKTNAAGDSLVAVYRHFDTVKEDLTKLTTERDTVQELYFELQTEFSDRTDQLEGTVTNLNDQLEHMGSLIDTKEYDIMLLQTHNLSLREEIAHLEDGRNALIEQINLMHSDLEQVTTSAQIYEQDIGELGQEVAAMRLTLQSERSSMQKVIVLLAVGSKCLARAWKKARAGNVLSAEELKAAKERILQTDTVLVAKGKELEEEQKRSSKDRQEKEAVIHQQKEQLEEISKDLNEAKESNSGLTFVNAELTSANTELTSANVRLTSANAELVTVKAEMTSADALLVKDLTKAKGEAVEMGAERDTLVDWNRKRVRRTLEAIARAIFHTPLDLLNDEVLEEYMDTDDCTFVLRQDSEPNTIYPLVYWYGQSADDNIVHWLACQLDITSDCQILTQLQLKPCLSDWQDAVPWLMNACTRLQCTADDRTPSSHQMCMMLQHLVLLCHMSQYTDPEAGLVRYCEQRLQELADSAVITISPVLTAMHGHAGRVLRFEATPSWAARAVEIIKVQAPSCVLDGSNCHLDDMTLVRDEGDLHFVVWRIGQEDESVLFFQSKDIECVFWGELLKIALHLRPHVMIPQPLVL